MKRETSNIIRFIIEDLFPPIVRDSFIFTFLIKKFYRSDKLHFDLRKKILVLSKDKYKSFYENSPNIHNESDLSAKCINLIKKNIVPKKIIDIGCGNGFLINSIKNKKLRIFASDLKINKKTLLKFKKENISFKEENIMSMNYLKNSFDTVICTHVLEHLIDIKEAYDKLFEITKKRLIIVVPRERPYKYTFNAHIHFFPYSWSFINTIKPKKKFKIIEVGRDFFYIENK